MIKPVLFAHRTEMHTNQITTVASRIQNFIRLIGAAIAAFGLAACEPATTVSSDAPQIGPNVPAPAVLVFSRTAGWRHNYGIAGADLFFAELAAEKGFGFFTTANSAVFNDEDLSRFEVIVFNNVTGAAFSIEERAAFERWMKKGGSWLGLHGSGDFSLTGWPWYQDNLIGARFIGHTMAPQFQTARLIILDPSHPVTDNLPVSWEHRDEWYSFDKVPDAGLFNPLIGIDESSYSPTNTIVDRWPEDLRMGASPDQHPMIWATKNDCYRGVYSAIGHGFESYRDPNYRSLLSYAFDWVSDSERDLSACD